MKVRACTCVYFTYLYAIEAFVGMVKCKLYIPFYNRTENHVASPRHKKRLLQQHNYNDVEMLHKLMHA